MNAIVSVRGGTGSVVLVVLLVEVEEVEEVELVVATDVLLVVVEPPVVGATAGVADGEAARSTARGAAATGVQAATRTATANPIRLGRAI